MPVANLNGLQVIIHEGKVLINAEQWTNYLVKYKYGSKKPVKE